MKIKLLKGTSFRGKKYKKGTTIEVPLGLANQMILNGMAAKV